MSFRSKILLALALVGLVPVALTGVISDAVNREELEKTVGRSQAAVAAELALECERYVARALESLRQSAELLPLDQLSRQELGAVLRVPYLQLDFVRALAMLDHDHGLLAAPAFGPRGNRPDPDPAATEAEVDAFLRRVPLRLALDAGTAMSNPYKTARGQSRVAVALRLQGGRRVIAAELALQDIDASLRNVSDGSVALVAAADGTILAGSAETKLTAPERELQASARGPASRLLRRGDGQEWLASAARVPQMNWTVLVAQPSALAFRAAHRVRLYTLFWGAVSLALIGGLGLVLSRSLTASMQKLSQAVGTLGEGRWDIRLDVGGRDEIGKFASAFREMAAGMQKRDQEIRAWNAELQQRVEARNAELQAAQDQILRTRKLAALGGLSAGIAHELNNPVTAITGLLTLVMAELSPDAPQMATLQTIQQQAYRVAKIVEEVRRFTEAQRGKGVRFALERPVRAALEECAAEIDEKKIRLSTELGARCEAQGDPRQIQQVIGHLVRNAIQAMPGGGDLKVHLSDVAGDALRLSVSDTGNGIPKELRERIFDPFFTTKHNGSKVGLGLSISHTIVEAHHGRILVDSVEGQGSTFTVVLPAAPAAASLV